MTFLLRLIWTLSVLTIINKVKGYSDGRFPEACGTLLPVHVLDGKPINVRPPPPPFKIEAVVTGPSLYTVTLSSTGSEAFRGFMLEAQNKTDNRSVGAFIILDSFSDARLLTCNGIHASAVSQKLNHDKRLIRVKWTSGVGDMGVIFRVTFLQNFDTFWDPLYYIPPPTTTTPRPATTTATTTTTINTATTTNTTSTATTTTTTNTATTTTTTTTTNTTNTTNTATTTNTTNTATTTNTTPTSTPPPKHCSCNVLKVSGAEMTAVFILSVIVENLDVIEPNFPLLPRIKKCKRRFIFVLPLVPKISVLLLFSVQLCWNYYTWLAVVTTVFGFVKLVLVCLNVGRSHELKLCYDIGIAVLSIIDYAFAVAFIFVVIDNCSISKPWLFWVMILFTVFIVLYFIHIFFKTFNTRKPNQQKSIFIALSTIFVLILACSVTFIVGLCM